MTSGLQNPASSFSYASVDREGLKRLGIGLALAAAILAFILEKVC